MSETVTIALITTAAGFFGALLGAVAAVFGPWWVRKTDRDHQASLARIEARRAAIVEWVDAQISLSNRVISGDEETSRRSIRANAALTELVSRLEPGEGAIATWLAGIARYGSTGVSSYTRRKAFGYGGQMLLSWHRGDRNISDVKPFAFGSEGAELRDSWPAVREIVAFQESTPDA